MTAMTIAARMMKAMTSAPFMSAFSNSSCRGQVLDRRGQDDQTESDLVDEIREVVDDVEAGFVDAARIAANEIAERIDGPADGDDEAQPEESQLRRLVAAGR